MGRSYGAPAPQALTRIPNEDIDFDGTGEILTVDTNPNPGSRKLEIDPQTGDINDETYTQLPTAHYVIRQFGAAQKEVALTFDDGPDAQWTPQILDILKAKNVKATFFVIGANAEANPGLVQRILAEGHELGNHTYTHPNLSDTPSQAVALELNATQRLFEALTGRSLRLFRPPYLGDAEPTDDDEIVPVLVAQSWATSRSASTSIRSTGRLPGDAEHRSKSARSGQSQARRPPRTCRPTSSCCTIPAATAPQTVAALPIMIDRLRAQGYHFVLVSDLMHYTRDQAMPRRASTLSMFMDRIVFLTLNALGNVLYFCFLVAIWLGILRLLALAA